MKRHHEHQPVASVKRRHCWETVEMLGLLRGDIEHCDDCGITRTLDGWRDRWGEPHTGAIPRCGAS